MPASPVRENLGCCQVRMRSLKKSCYPWETIIIANTLQSVTKLMDLSSYTGLGRNLMADPSEDKSLPTSITFGKKYSISMNFWLLNCFPPYMQWPEVLNYISQFINTVCTHYLFNIRQLTHLQLAEDLSPQISIWTAYNTCFQLPQMETISFYEYHTYIFNWLTWVTWIYTVS